MIEVDRLTPFIPTIDGRSKPGSTGLPGQKHARDRTDCREDQLLEADVLVLGRDDLNHLRQAQEIVVDVQIVVIAGAACTRTLS